MHPPIYICNMSHHKLCEVLIMFKTFQDIAGGKRERKHIQPIICKACLNSVLWQVYHQIGAQLEQNCILFKKTHLFTDDDWVLFCISKVVVLEWVPCHPKSLTTSWSSTDHSWESSTTFLNSQHNLMLRSPTSIELCLDLITF